jgi:hypothetical protein
MVDSNSAGVTFWEVGFFLLATVVLLCNSKSRIGSDMCFNIMIGCALVIPLGEVGLYQRDHS